MSKAGKSMRDGVWAILISTITAAALYWTGLSDNLEGMLYDTGVHYAERTPSDQIAILAIDDKSIDVIGRWPWSRQVIANLIDKLNAEKPKSIINTSFYFEPQTDAGLAYISKALSLIPPPSAEVVASQTAMGLPAEDPKFASVRVLLQSAEKDLNVDRKLAESLKKAGNVSLPMLPNLALTGSTQGRSDPLPPFLSTSRIGLVMTPSDTSTLNVPSVSRWQTPLESLGKYANGIGFLTVDTNSVVRQELLYLQAGDDFYPSLSLLAATQALNLKPADIQLKLGGTVGVGSLSIPASTAGTWRPFFYHATTGSPFAVDSLSDVLTGNLPASKYKDKIVLIGATAAGVGDKFATPVSDHTSPVELLAHSVSAILNGDFIRSPTWAVWVEWGALGFVMLYLMFGVPRLSAGVAGGVSLLLLIGLIGGELVPLITRLEWVQLALPATVLFIGHILLTTRRFLFTEQGKVKADADSAESNRMLGLAFQGQGQLDLAYDKFRKCPLDDTLMDILYALAQDFERKRQFNKAFSVFEYMSGFNPKYKDLTQRLARAKTMQDTVILGGSGGHGAAATLITPGVEKPMLGRYEIDRELGKGAMGVVYFGKDPKIGRVVAIKTMALAQEFAGEDLDEARSRFFREAETAGRLNHPNIVTIYDAGEEHDLAYIAMEFLKGKDLVDNARAGKLLPVSTVLAIIAHVADALDYAHKQSVVHRDIKPANIMFEPDQSIVKVTDFGIARITDSSRTKTGMVLGTPSYMSPEQLSGKKIDGRSDLFSLGVTLYQLLCGQLPFHGESMAELMFRITNDPARDITQFNPNLSRDVLAVVQKSLMKDAEKRFQTGGEFAQALHACRVEHGL